MPHQDSALLAGLADRFDEQLGTALAGATEVALLNFPNHGNPGDSALWLGARASLRRLGVRICYRCAWCTYSPAALAAALPDGPVLLNGGGNFGDLYAGQQGLRERVFAELHGRRVIQLPQSIHFREQRNLDRNRRLVAEHGDVTLMLRDQASYDLASEQFDAASMLAPDAALALRGLPRLSADPSTDVLWLHRRPKDPEYVDHGTLPTDLKVREIEWLGKVEPEYVWPPVNRAGRAVNTRLLERCRTDERWARHAWRPLGATFVPYGEGHVLRGLSILVRGRVLVTDKLHGHLMALLAGIPHVVLDNSYGKVSGAYRTWTHPSTLTHWADSGDEAFDLARTLLADSSP